MTDLLEALFKFFGEPLTLRRIAIFSLIVGATLGGFVFYEAYTASFRLGRLQKSADLLVRLQELEAGGTNGTAESQRARKLLWERTLAAIEATPVRLELLPAKLTLSLDSLWKFLAGSAFWLLLAVFQIKKWKSLPGRKEILGQVLVAILAGAGATLVPAVWWPWFHLLVYPYLFMVALLAIAVPFVVLLSAMARAKMKAQATQCLLNLKGIGLSARMWATDHGGQLPGNAEVLMQNLPGRQMRCCPSDPTGKYVLLSPGATEADPSVAYARCPHHDLVVLTDGSVQKTGKNQLVQEGHVWRFKSSETGPVAG